MKVDVVYILSYLFWLKRFAYFSYKLNYLLYLYIFFTVPRAQPSPSFSDLKKSFLIKPTFLHILEIVILFNNLSDNSLMLLLLSPRTTLTADKNTFKDYRKPFQQKQPCIQRSRCDYIINSSFLFPNIGLSLTKLHQFIK